MTTLVEGGRFRPDRLQRRSHEKNPERCPFWLQLLNEGLLWTPWHYHEGLPGRSDSQGPAD